MWEGHNGNFSGDLLASKSITNCSTFFGMVGMATSSVNTSKRVSLQDFQKTGQTGQSLVLSVPKLMAEANVCVWGLTISGNATSGSLASSGKSGIPKFETMNETSNSIIKRQRGVRFIQIQNKGDELP